MSIEDNKALLRRFYDEVINQGNLDLVDELVAEDFVDHEAAFPGLPTTGPEAPRAAFRLFRAAFADGQITVDEMIGEGDMVAVRARFSGTHTGEFMGMAPTNKSFEVQLFDMAEIHDGKMKAHWGLTDQGAMMEQLGLAPEM